jgi:hypothetical protein
MKILSRMGIATLLTGALFAACSSGPASGTASSGAGGNGSGGASGTQSTNTSTSTGEEIVGGTFSASVGAGGADSCGGQATTAEPIPLDIYLMLDSSGSMNDKTGSGVSKWDAVTQALSAFFGDTSSAGLGVGLQHFPLAVAGLPATCTANADCPGTSSPCFLNVCTKFPSLTACTTNTDCASVSGSTCIPLGKCGTDLCAPVGTVCQQNGLTCAKVTTSTCAHPDSCVTADYSAPAVEISPLNGAAQALNTAIGTIVPNGATPTSAALQGAIAHAKEWAAANPTHEVIVLLATDGLPTECTPTDINQVAQIAADGLNGTPKVKTFVIGVFSPLDTGAKINLDTIASKGGTASSFIIDTTQDVEKAFLAALTAIRGTTLACEFNVPEPTDAGALDFNEVNVEYTAAGASAPTTIGYATSLNGCDATNGGWYYDVDPASGATPTKIIMCPATCTKFNTEIGGKVNIRIGCKTVVVTPK